MNKYLIWSGPATDPSGYGEATRGYALGLSRQENISVKLLNRSFWPGDPPDLHRVWPALKKMNSNNFDRRNAHISIQHLTPDQYMLSAGNCKYQIGMTTFETSNIPPAWQMNLRAMDEIMTFSNWMKGIFINEGIRRPISVIPHGVDIVRFNPGNEPLDELKRSPDGAIRPDDFVFGANFDWTERKNPTALLKAYFSAFKATDPVVLVLKSYYQYLIEHSRQFITGYIDQLKLRLGLRKTPRIVLMTDMMSQEQLPRFYASLNAYVLPSRGEGWGLTYTEAMASALPTIAVNWSAHTEYMNRTNSVLCVDFKLEDISQQDAAFQPHYIGHKWATVNFEEVARHMRFLFENPEICASLGYAARKTMVDKFTWNDATNTLMARLNKIYADNLKV